MLFDFAQAREITNFEETGVFRRSTHGVIKTALNLITVLTTLPPCTGVHTLPIKNGPNGAGRAWKNPVWLLLVTVQPQ